MKLIRYLENIKLLKINKEKQNNGSFIKEYTFIKDYKVQKKSINNNVNATIYGANIIKMWNISTALKDLERYLIPKIDNIEDNISDYLIKLDNNKYKIISVNEESGIVIERI